MLKRSSIFYLLYILFLLPKVDDLQTYGKFQLNCWLIKVVIDFFSFSDVYILLFWLIWLLFLRLLSLFITSDYPAFLELCSQRSTSFTLNCFLWASSGQSSHSLAGRPVQMGWLSNCVAFPWQLIYQDSWAHLNYCLSLPLAFEFIISEVTQKSCQD